MKRIASAVLALFLAGGAVIPVLGGDINIGGDFNFRFRHNNDKDAGKKGFELYEFELFIDAAVHKHVSIFGELPIYHSNRIDLGNAWIDFHKDGELAATGYTGLMVGHIMPWFGFYGYDDNQSWIYGGRTTTNSILARAETIDGTVMRDRQVGIAANIKLGNFLFTPQIYNGSGFWAVAGGADNDNAKDIVFRAQYALPNEIARVGIGYWNSPKTKGALEPSRGTAYGGSGVKHPRDIQRVCAFLQFPNVPHATVPDLSLGDKPFTIFGEYILSRFKGNSGAPGYEADFDAAGYWVEANVRIVRNKLVGVVRYDFLDPNTDIDDNELTGITPALKLELVPMTFLTLGYEFYDGGEKAGKVKNDDRIVAEMSIQF